MQNREEIVWAVQSKVRLFASNLGLQPSNADSDVLIHRYSWGVDRLSLPGIHFHPEHIHFSLAIDRRINAIEELWQEWHNLVNVNVADPDLISTVYISHKNSYPEITREKFYDGFGFLQFPIDKSLESNLTTALSLIFEKMKIKATELNDLKNIDRRINAKPDPPSDINDFFFIDGALMFKRIILAKLTNNPIYEQMCDTYRDRFGKIEEISKKPGKEYYLNYPGIFEALYTRLANTAPLSSTILV
jgi:hypothetical protein